MANYRSMLVGSIRNLPAVKISSYLPSSELPGQGGCLCISPQENWELSTNCINPGHALLGFYVPGKNGNYLPRFWKRQCREIKIQICKINK